MASPEGRQPPSVGTLRRAAAGDLDAFTSVYRDYHQIVFRFARAMLGSPQAAEDVTQEVFVVLLTDPSRYDPERAKFTTYLYGIVRNLTRERLRRDARFLSLEALAGPESESSTAPGPFEQLEDAQLAGHVRRALRSLPAGEREVIVLCDLHGLSYADAAAVVGASVAAVRSRLHRGRQLLRRKLARVIGVERRPKLAAARCALGGTS